MKTMGKRMTAWALGTAMLLSMAACSPKETVSSQPEESTAPTAGSSSAESTTNTAETTGSLTEENTSSTKAGITTRKTAATTQRATQPTKGETMVPIQIQSYVIVQGKSASAAEKRAATELQTYLQKICGKKLPIVADSTAPVETEFVIGKTNREGKGYTIDRGRLGEDGFQIKKAGKRMVIAGGSRGTLYGVYDFLERYLGCRFYAKNVEKVPTVKPEAFKLPDTMNVTEIPALEIRGLGWYNAYSPDIASKLRVNDPLMGFTYPDASYGVRPKYAKDMTVHTFGKLLETRLFYIHPEYFCLNDINGKKVRTDKQLCLTNPEVLKIVTENVKKALREDPAATTISVSQNDVIAPCICDNCAKIDAEEGSHAGTLIRFVNAVADAIKGEFPQITVETLAYFYTADPPKTKPRDNVSIRLCTARNCCSHPFETDDHDTTNTFRKNLEGWAKLTDNLLLWDYTTNFNYYLMTFPNLRALAPNIQYLHKNHVKGIFAQGNFQSENGEFGELRSYLLAKLMWNPQANVDVIINDFLEGYYGAGWKYIRRYIDTFHDLTASRHLTSTIANSPEAILPMDHVKIKNFVSEAAEWWQAAEKAVSGAQKERVNRSSLQFLFYRQVVTELPEKVNGNAQSKAAWLKRNQELIDGIRKYDLSIGENGRNAVLDVNQSPVDWRK